MALFPFFINLEGRTGLVVGGGRTALDKVRRLLDYGVTLRVTAPEALPELETLPGVELVRRPFDECDLDESPAFVVAAADCIQIGRAVAELCRARRIPVNVVDAPEYSTFFFPALVRRGPLSIGISTDGASPSAAVYFKEMIDSLLPDHIEEILDWLKRQRKIIKGQIGSEAIRKRVFQRLFAESLDKKCPLTQEEVCAAVIEAEREVTE
jgi:siroheme synthase-like protein